MATSVIYHELTCDLLGQIAQEVTGLGKIVGLSYDGVLRFELEASDDGEKPPRGKKRRGG